MLTWATGTFRLEPGGEMQVMEEIQESAEALLMEGVRQLDEFQHLKKGLPPLGSPLAVPTPLAGKLRDLTPSELDTFQLVLDHGQLESPRQFPGTDLEAAQNVIQPDEARVRRRTVIVFDSPLATRTTDGRCARSRAVRARDTRARRYNRSVAPAQVRVRKQSTISIASDRHIAACRAGRSRLRLTVSIEPRGMLSCEVTIDVDDAIVEVCDHRGCFAVSGIEQLFVVERQPPAWRFLTWFGVFARRHGRGDRLCSEDPDGRGRPVRRTTSKSVSASATSPCVAKRGSRSEPGVIRPVA